MEVISVMNIQVPSADIRDAHVVTAQFRRLDVPDDVFAVRVLVSNFHQGRGDAIHSLPIDIESIPRVRELDNWVGFESLLEEDALYSNSQVDES